MACMGSEGDRRFRPAPNGGGDVMAAVDQSGSIPTFIVADVTADDVWIAMPEEQAPSLADWR